LVKRTIFPINVLRPVLWILRRNEDDVVNLYNSATPFVEAIVRALARTKDQNMSTMLNFGYWTHSTKNPLEAQQQLVMLIAEFGEFHAAKTILDVGSGFSSPAILWKQRYPNLLDIICIDINFQQLTIATTSKSVLGNNFTDNPRLLPNSHHVKSITTTTFSNEIIPSLVNATATVLPLSSSSVDRVVSLEAAQHFRPLLSFFREAKRILKPHGQLIIAIPVIGPNISDNVIIQFLDLGILYFPWASEHYSLGYITSILNSENFKIESIRHIGRNVYEPMTDYYVSNREFLMQTLKGKLDSFAERIIFEIIESILDKSSLKMKDLSQKRVIEYVLIKAMKPF
jgi:ubiquinone/menaquinone biosynthesis C-methylase UbiE